MHDKRTIENAHQWMLIASNNLLKAQKAFDALLYKDAITYAKRSKALMEFTIDQLEADDVDSTKLHNALAGVNNWLMRVEVVPE